MSGLWEPALPFLGTLCGALTQSAMSNKVHQLNKDTRSTVTPPQANGFTVPGSTMQGDTQGTAQPGWIESSRKVELPAPPKKNSSFQLPHFKCSSSLLCPDRPGNGHGTLTQSRFLREPLEEGVPGPCAMQGAAQGRREGHVPPLCLPLTGRTYRIFSPVSVKASSTQVRGAARAPARPGTVAVSGDDSSQEPQGPVEVAQGPCLHGSRRFGERPRPHPRLSSAGEAAGEKPPGHM